MYVLPIIFHYVTRILSSLCVRNEERGILLWQILHFLPKLLFIHYFPRKLSVYWVSYFSELYSSFEFSPLFPPVLILNICIFFLLSETLFYWSFQRTNFWIFFVLFRNSLISIFIFLLHARFVLVLFFVHFKVDPELVYFPV